MLPDCWCELPCVLVIGCPASPAGGNVPCCCYMAWDGPSSGHQGTVSFWFIHNFIGGTQYQVPAMGCDSHRPKSNIGTADCGIIKGRSRGRTRKKRILPTGNCPSMEMSTDPFHWSFINSDLYHLNKFRLSPKKNPAKITKSHQDQWRTNFNIIVYSQVCCMSVNINTPENDWCIRLDTLFPELKFSMTFLWQFLSSMCVGWGVGGGTGKNYRF